MCHFFDTICIISISEWVEPLNTLYNKKIVLGEECHGGQIYTECDGHCLAKCDNPDPVCSRVCTPGCNCPVENSIWDGQQCIEARLCPTERGMVFLTSFDFSDGF